MAHEHYRRLTTNSRLIQGYIEFEDESSARHLSSRRYIFIDGKKVDIQSCIKHSVEINNIENELVHSQAENSSQITLNSLNDDCLHEIFRRLPFSSFSAVMTVCKRFHIIAKEALRRKCLNKHIDLNYLTRNPSPELHQVEIFLKEFGSSIKSLTMSH